MLARPGSPAGLENVSKNRMSVLRMSELRRITWEEYQNRELYCRRCNVLYADGSADRYYEPITEDVCDLAHELARRLSFDKHPAVVPLLTVLAWLIHDTKGARQSSTSVHSHTRAANTPDTSSQL